MQDRNSNYVERLMEDRKIGLEQFKLSAQGNYDFICYAQSEINFCILMISVYVSGSSSSTYVIKSDLFGIIYYMFNL